MSTNSNKVFVMDDSNDLTAEQVKNIKELIDAGKDKEAKAYIKQCTEEIFKKMWKNQDEASNQ